MKRDLARSMTLYQEGDPVIAALRIGTILLAFVEGLYGAFSDDFEL